MPKNNEIKIKRGSSSLSEFVKRPLATEEEVEAFDRYAMDEAKEEEIKNSLRQIYQDDDGNQPNNNRLVTGKKRGWLFNLFILAVVIFTLGGAVYASYNYLYLRYYADKTSVSLVIESKEQVAAGEEFFYDLNYKNGDKVGIKNIIVRAAYPDNFIFISSEPAATAGNNTWEIAGLASHRSDVIKIKGKLVGQQNSDNIINADIFYAPENFSSEFKKSASFTSKINDLGIDIAIANSASAQLNEENEIIVKFKAKDQNYLNNFRLSLERPEEVQITVPAGPSATGSSAGLIIAPAGTDAWLLSNFGKNENEFKVKFKIKEKKTPQVQLKLKLELPAPAALPGQPEKYYSFYEQLLVCDVLKSDLNVNLIINGSNQDQGVNFGQTLNYSISYNNLGESAMPDVIIMAVLESDFLDWQTLSDKNNGQVSGHTLSWSKAEIPALASLASGAEGVIDFSIKLKPQAELDLSKAYQVKNYVRFSVAGKEAGAENQSNIITNKINSDLSLTEQLRYFNDDNLAVGYGPLPPKAGQATGLKVYWRLNNNLHELTGLTVSVALPAGVVFDNKNLASIGNLSYDALSNRVIWRIDRLPISVYRADAEFNIAVTPGATDRNKIMVLLPGTQVNALDDVTGAQISKTLKAKTSKLDDDPMATGDGIVQ